VLADLAPDLRFADTIETEEELRAACGRPSWFQSKILTKLDAQCRRFIAESPFMVLASTDAGGRVDTSPKGDEPGFVQVLDDVTLAIPDRDGNRRFDTFTNVLQNPNVGLILFVPGRRETLRINGKARIVRDLALRDSMALKGKSPKVATVVFVERAFFHCGSCIARAKLWDHR
jgi:PPOX class probable FMN-dependent enzyme